MMPQTQAMDAASTPASYCGVPSRAKIRNLNPAEPEVGQIEFVNKDVDDPNRIVITDPILQTFWKQRTLLAIRSFNEAPHPILLQIAFESYRENHLKRCAFSHSQGQKLTPVLRLISALGQKLTRAFV